MENLEQEEIDLLAEKGFKFYTKIFGRKVLWNTGKISLGKMFRLSDVFIKMKVDEVGMMSNDLSVQIPLQYQSVRDNAKLCAEAVAIAVDSKLPKWFLKRHFLNSLDAKEMSDFALELLKFSNYQNFMTSTVLMNGNRPTKAMPIESPV